MKSTLMIVMFVLIAVGCSVSKITEPSCHITLTGSREPGVLLDNITLSWVTDCPDCLISISDSNQDGDWWMPVADVPSQDGSYVFETIINGPVYVKMIYTCDEDVRTKIVIP